MKVEGPSGVKNAALVITKCVLMFASVLCGTVALMALGLAHRLSMTVGPLLLTVGDTAAIADPAVLSHSFALVFVLWAMLGSWLQRWSHAVKLVRA